MLIADALTTAGVIVGIVGTMITTVISLMALILQIRDRPFRPKKGEVIATKVDPSQPRGLRVYTEADMRRVIPMAEQSLKFRRMSPLMFREPFLEYLKRRKRRRRLLPLAGGGVLLLAIGLTLSLLR